VYQVGINKGTSEDTRRTTDTFLFISHTTNVLLFKCRCNIFIGVRIIKEMPGSVASGTPCIHPFQNVFLRCPTPRLHCFLSSHWPSFRFISLMAFLIPPIQFFYGLPRAFFCFVIHFNAILGNLPSAIL